MFDTLRTRLHAFLKQLEKQNERWLRIGQVDIDFDVYPELPYQDLQPLKWDKNIGFVELEALGRSGFSVERWIPLHESKPQVHVIRQLKDGRMYRLGLSMPSEADDNMPHGRYGAWWIERK